jgi:uncharacterized protein
MTGVVTRYPGVSLLALAMSIGAVLIAPVAAGLAPPAFLQLGALSASAAGIILAALEGGRGAVRELLRRVLIWRVGLGWWLFALLFPIIPTVGALYLGAAVGGRSVDWTGLPSVLGGIPTLLFLIVFAGLGEEFGWRGFAVPRLQRRYHALVAGLMIGGLHSLWHLPLFFVKGEAYHNLVLQFGFLPSFLGYAVLVTASAVQFSWLFNQTGGSVLLAAVYHGASNAWNGYFDIFRVGMTGVYAYVALMVAGSIVIAIGLGPKSLSRGPSPAVASA